MTKAVPLPAVKQQLDKALVKICHHHTIYVIWSFAEVDPCGSGTILNFHGAPDTGKTLTAEAFSGSIGNRLISVRIADLESKFVGAPQRTSPSYSSRYVPKTPCCS